MTSLWHICSSALAVVICASAASVTGHVQLRDSRDSQVRKRMDYSGVVIWLERAGVTTPPAPVHARMLQKDKTFIPHVLAVPVGSTVDFPNGDPIFHNAFSNYDGQLFDVGLYAPGTSRSVRFQRPGIVRVFCNIHANMSAIVAVLDSAKFAVTGADGRFSIDAVEPADYILRVFHERATPATLNGLARKITVGADGAVAGTILISESGYLPAPHKNKYGREYGPPPGDSAYPATHR